MNREKNFKYAPPLLRLVARLIDISLSWLIVIILIRYVSDSGTLIELLDNLLSSLFIILISINIGGIIFSLSDSQFGGSPGKLLSGLRLVDPKGNYLSFKLALFRNYIARTVAGLIFGAGYIWILRDGRRQGWHDMASGTYVLVKNKYGYLSGILSLLLLIIFMVLLILQIIQNVNSNSILFTQILFS